MSIELPHIDSDPRAAFTFSPSSLQDYLDCPRRFELHYLLDALWPTAEAEPLLQVEARQRDGLLFHRMVQQHFLGLPDARLVAMASTPDLARWYGNFANAAPDLSGWTLYAEKALTCQLGAHRLICKYDLIAIRGGKAVIYDWKTFGHRPKDEWLAARMQTKAYLAMLIRAGAELNVGRAFEPTDVSMIYWFAEFPDAPARFEYDSLQYSRDWQMLAETADQAAAASIFPLTSDLTRCKFCTYRSLCNRGTKAGVDVNYEPHEAAAASTEDGWGQIGESQA